MAFWTIEEVAGFLDITVSQVYESRRRKEYPGIIGKQRGRRLMFDQALVEAGPQPDANATEDASVAILWALGGIETKLAAILKELVNQRPQYVELVTEETTTYEIDLEEE